MNALRLAPLLDDPTLVEPPILSPRAFVLPSWSQESTGDQRAIIHGLQPALTSRVSSNGRSFAERPDFSGAKTGVSLAEVLNEEETAAPSTWHSTRQSLPDSSTRKRRRLDEERRRYVELPRPPIPREKTRQQPRIPPLLQGLHEPPPDSGLFPSIEDGRLPNFSAQLYLPSEPVNLSTQKRYEVLDELVKPSTVHREPSAHVSSLKHSPKSSKLKKSSEVHKKRKHKWSDAETKNLVDGVAKFGIGRWKRILMCPDYNFNQRSAVDLKDKFRVCFPDQYKGELKRSETSGVAKARHEGREKAKASPADPATEESNSTQPFFAPAKRRDRILFTEAEDEDLLKGYAKYGWASWRKIRNDSEFDLLRRTPRDLRDRFRNRWPQLYTSSSTKDNGVTRDTVEDDSHLDKDDKTSNETPVDQSQKVDLENILISPGQLINVTPSLERLKSNATGVTLDRSILDRTERKGESYYNNSSTETSRPTELPPVRKALNIDDMASFVDPSVVLKTPFNMHSRIW